MRRLITLLRYSVITLFCLLLGCADPFATVTPEASDSAELLTAKAENARLIAEIEYTKAQSGAEINRLMEESKAQIAAQADTHAMEVKALENDIALAKETKAQAIYPAQKWLWAIIAAAIACVVYSYRALNFAAAAIGLACFAGLFGLILAGQYYPRVVAVLPLPMIALTVYFAHRAGVITAALKACVKGIEAAGDKATKNAVALADDRGAVDKAGAAWMNQQQE